MRRRLWMLVGLAAAVVVAPIAWYLLSPLWISRTVNEDLPVVAAAPATSAMSATAASLAASMDASPMATPAASVAASMDASPMAPAEAMADAAMPSPTAVVSATPIPAAPQLLRSGEFHAVVHDGMGTAAIYALADGTRVLRLENFEVLNGPDLYVWLSSAADASDSRTILASQYAEVGRLKGDRGNQNYILPAELDLATYNSVTIWCRRFSVNFVTAPLSAAPSSP